MKKPGYYYKRAEKGNSNVAWQKAVLRKDGKDILSVTAQDAHKGLQVSPDNKQLLLDGVKIAEATDPSLVDFSADTFGNIPLSTSSKVINITLADYNRLRSGDVPKGYRRYDPKAVYNIVANIATTGELYVEDFDEDVAEDSILANMLGTLPDNELKTAQDKLDYGRNTYTFISPTNGTPHLSVYNPTAVIEPGGAIEFDYMVDTRNMAGLNLCQFGQTFTVIVEDMFGRELFRRTTYAGIFHCRIEGIKDEDGDDNFIGEGWWSIRAIDGNHVDSVTHYFDFLSKEADTRQMYHMTQADLETYGITLGASATPQQGWMNKRGLSNLMADKAGTCKGVVLYNPGNAVYGIDYHKNLAGSFSDDNPAIDLGQHKFYVVRLYDDENGIRQWAEQEIVQGGSVTINGTSISVNEDPFDFIKHDGAKLFRDGNDKVKVCWTDTEKDPRDAETQVLSTSANTYLRTSIRQRLLFEKNSSKVLNYVAADAGYYYMVGGTVPYKSGLNWVGGDYIKFPDNFTLDLNGATLKGIQCYDLRNECRLINLQLCTDTHLVNGKIEGLYTSEYDWEGAFLFNGLRLTTWGNCAEGIQNVTVEASRFCSLENIESAFSMGYDMIDRFSAEGVPGYSTTQSVYPTSLGYVDQDGNEKDTTDPSPLSLVPRISSDYRADSTAAVNLVITDMKACSMKDISIVSSQKWHYGVGKQHELFVHWYKNTGTAANPVWRFLKTVKTQFYLTVKKPADATHYRVSGYGLSHISGGKRVMTSITKTIDGVSQQIAKAWEQGQSYMHSHRGCGNCYKDCYVHDTRSCAMTAVSSKNVSYVDCRWREIAIEDKYSLFKITGMLGDWEEGWQYRDTITMIGCSAGTELPEGSNNHNKRVIQANTARNLLMADNRGFTFKDCGGIESAWIHDNEFVGLRTTRNYFFERPCVYFRNNTIAKHSDQDNDSQRQFTYLPSLTTKNNDTDLRYNRCDDPISNVFAMVDCVAPLMIDRNGYYAMFNFVLQRSKLGDNYKD